MVNGFFIQLCWGAITTLNIAFFSALFGIVLGLILALIESTMTSWLRYFVIIFIYIIRGLPELVILFFIYYGSEVILSYFFGTYIAVSPFLAGVVALSLIFGAYASQVFKGAFAAIESGQVESAIALGFSRRLIFTRIKLPQAFRHALPGLGNLWLVLLKDTAVIMLIGLHDLMGSAKIAANSTHQPFTFYLLAAFLYLLITALSKVLIAHFTKSANKYIFSHDQLFY